MGRKTFDVNKEDFPFPNALNVVLTKNRRLFNENEKEQILFTNLEPDKLLKYLANKGYKKALLIGGRKTNSAFVERDLIDEIMLIVHPLIFGAGMEIFLKSNMQLSLKLTEVKKLKQDLVRLHYKVIK